MVAASEWELYSLWMGKSTNFLNIKLSSDSDSAALTLRQFTNTLEQPLSITAMFLDVDKTFKLLSMFSYRLLSDYNRIAI